MKIPITGATIAVLSLTVVASTQGQWLNRRTPNIPRTPDGKPNLEAPAPRQPDGRPDLSGIWFEPDFAGVLVPVPDDALAPKSKDLLRERRDNYFKDRPAFQCRPNGPEPMGGWKRIIQTPTLITILNDDLTYRLIFLDGRELETDPLRTWMGYSVGHWDGDTLMVESYGFNERTWLDARGLPHTEALRTTERYRRRTYGLTEVELSVTDPGAFEKSWTVSYELQFRPDTEMLEAVCDERDQSHWVGHVSDADRGAVAVPVARLARYVGVYSGRWGPTQRTVRIELDQQTLYANGILGEKVRLIPQSSSLFMGTNGLWYQFDSEGTTSAFVVERHVSGDWRYARQSRK
jgi:hypothetical protein